MCASERDTPPSMVGRVSLIFGAFGPDDDGLGIRELGRRTGLATSTVSRIVRELIEYKFLEPAGNEVRIGLRFFELGERAARPQQLRRLALASMSDLRSATRQTVHLAVLDGTDVVYVTKLRSRTAPPLGSRVGGRLPALGLFAVNALAVISYSHVLFSEGFEAAIGQHYFWGFMLAMLAVYGPGAITLDRLTWEREMKWNRTATAQG